jgi:5-methylcytosine-specific restriction endonuclease McrA
MNFKWDFPKYDEKWPIVSKQCKARDGNKCTKCGNAGTKNNPLHSHHVVSKSHGGSDSLDNVRTLCSACHSQEKGHAHMKCKSKTRLNLPF